MTNIKMNSWTKNQRFLLQASGRYKALKWLESVQTLEV
jgi:hypothetical protein